MKVPPLSLITDNNRNIARALMLVATLYFGWRMAGILWLLAGQDQAELAKPMPTASLAQSTTVDGSQLANFAFFKQITTASSNSTNAPDTVLQLKLDGVFASNNNAQSSAIISEQGQVTGKLYRVGQQVSSGVTLSAVYVDRVLLQRNGIDEVLRFVKTNLLGGDAPIAQPVASPNKRGARDLLSQAIGRLEAEPSAYLSEMGLLARNGQGYEITDNTPAHLRRNLSLKAGDKLLKLNGQPLGNPQRDKDLLQQVQQTGHARIDIQRGSQTLTIEQNF